MLQIFKCVNIWVASFHDHVTIARSMACFCRECLEIKVTDSYVGQYDKKRDSRVPDSHFAHSRAIMKTPTSVLKVWTLCTTVTAEP